MRALALALLLPLAACGSDAVDTPATSPEAAPPEAEASGDAEPDGVESDAAAEDAPTGPDEAALDADAEADALAQMEADGVEDLTELGDLVVGDWSILVGPAEAVTFSPSETRGAGEVSFYLNNRLMDSGTWSAEGDALTINAPGVSGTYTLADSDLESLSFTGGMGAVSDEATMILERQ